MNLKQLYAILFFVVSLVAHSDVIHRMGKGETLEDVASMYGVPVDTILRLNPSASMVMYVGMELTIPGNHSNVRTDGTDGAYDLIASQYSVEEQLIMSQCKEGDGYLSVGDYNNAEKSYTNIIKLYGKGEYSCVNAYYGRGLSYYNRGKWGKAIDDFENAVSDYRCSSVVRDHCTKLLDNARKCREQEIQERNEFWGTLFATAAVVATTAIMANEQDGASPNTGNVGAGSVGEDYSDVDEPAETGNSASTSKSKSKCGACGGKGSTIEYVGNFGIDERPYCEECGKNVTSGHYHRTCTYCGGTGYR